MQKEMVLTKEFDPKANELYCYPLFIGDIVMFKVNSKLKVGKVYEIVSEGDKVFIRVLSNKNFYSVKKENVQDINLWVNPEVRKNNLKLKGEL